MGNGERTNLLIIIGQLMMLIHLLMEDLEPDKYNQYRKWVDHIDALIDNYAGEYR